MIPVFCFPPVLYSLITLPHLSHISLCNTDLFPVSHYRHLSPHISLDCIQACVVFSHFVDCLFSSVCVLCSCACSRVLMCSPCSWCVFMVLWFSGLSSLLEKPWSFYGPSPVLLLLGFCMSCIWVNFCINRCCVKRFTPLHLFNNFRYYGYLADSDYLVLIGYYSWCVTNQIVLCAGHWLRLQPHC